MLGRIGAPASQLHFTHVGHASLGLFNQRSDTPLQPWQAHYQAPALPNLKLLWSYDNPCLKYIHKTRFQICSRTIVQPPGWPPTPAFWPQPVARFRWAFCPSPAAHLLEANPWRANIDTSRPPRQCCWTPHPSPEVSVTLRGGLLVEERKNREGIPKSNYL